MWLQCVIFFVIPANDVSRRSVLKKFLVPKTKQSVHERATQTETIGYNISISIRQVFEKNSNIELQFEIFLKIF